jgi:hypothetical protein
MKEFTQEQIKTLQDLGFEMQNQNGMFNISIKVDSNDADYMYSNFECDKNAFDKVYVYLLTELNSSYSDNHDLEYVDDDLYEALDLPRTEYGRCHSLESIDITYADTTGIYDVELLSSLLEEHGTEKVYLAILRYQYDYAKDILLEEYNINEDQLIELKDLSIEELKVKLKDIYNYKNNSDEDENTDDNENIDNDEDDDDDDCDASYVYANNDEEYCLIELIKEYFSK